MLGAHKSGDYPVEVIQRAERSLSCSPFTIALLADLAKQGVALRAIASPNHNQDGIKNQYLKIPTNLVTTENSLLWLVLVGVLRREVDGQGITDSFRLTPLGHFLLEKWQTQGSFPSPSLIDRIKDFLAQWQPARFF